MFCFPMPNNLRKKNWGKRVPLNLLERQTRHTDKNNSIIRLPGTQYRNQKTLGFTGRVYEIFCYVASPYGHNKVLEGFLIWSPKSRVMATFLRTEF